MADNLNIGPEHFTEFSIIAPTDPVLGSYSGQVLDGLYTLSPEGAALGTNNQMVRASDWGDMSETFNGVDFIFDGRLPNGVTLAGGVATGAVAVNECFVVDNPMQNRPGYCSYAPAWSDRTQYKFNGSVPLPYDMAFSFVFQSIPGERRFSEYLVARQIDFVEQQLGHELLETGLRVPLFPSGIGFWTDARGGTLTTSRYIDNSVQYEPQVNQFDRAAHQDPALRRGAHPGQLRRLQHLQRQQRHPGDRHLLRPRRVPARDGDHERPPVQVRRDHRLVGRAAFQPAIPQGGGQPPPFFIWP